MRLLSQADPTLIPCGSYFLTPGCCTVSRIATEEKCLKCPAGELWFLSYTLNRLVVRRHLVSLRAWLTQEDLLAGYALSHRIVVRIKWANISKILRTGLETCKCYRIVSFNCYRDEWLQFNNYIPWNHKWRAICNVRSIYSVYMDVSRDIDISTDTDITYVLII